MTQEADGLCFGPKHLKQTTLHYSQFIENGQVKLGQHYAATCLSRGNIHLYTNHLTSELGLHGIPAPLKYLSKEVGLIGDPWANPGKQWQSLAKLWLCAETVLSKSNRNDLSFTQIHKSAIPEDWKDWMNAKLMNTNVRPPDESFGKSFTQYLKGL